MRQLKGRWRRGGGRCLAHRDLAAAGAGFQQAEAARAVMRSVPRLLLQRSVAVRRSLMVPMRFVPLPLNVHDFAAVT